MYCTNCGRELKEANCCPNCGQNVAHYTETKEKVMEVPEIEQPKEKKKKNKKWLIGLGIIALLGIMGTLFVLLGKSKSDKFIELIMNEDYEKAALFYEEEFVGETEELETAREFLGGKINRLVGEYYNSEISYDEIIEKLENYKEMYPEAFEVALQKVDDLKSSQEAFAEAEELLSLGEFAAAQELYAKVIKDDSNYDLAQKKYEECYENRKAILLQEVNSLVETKEYESAITALDSAVFIVEKDKSEIEELRANIVNKYKTSLLEELDSLMTAENYVRAFERMEDIELVFGDEKGIIDKRTSLKSLYEEYVVENVNMCIQEKEYATALEYVNQGLLYLESDSSLIELKNTIIEYFPISLMDVTLFESNLPGTKNIVGTPVDKYQNEYVSGILYYDTSWQDYKDSFNYKEREEVYLLNKQYTRFTATLAPYEKRTKKRLGEEHGTAVVSIYGDGVKLFSSSVWMDSKPVNIDIDVTGVEKLQIAFYRGHMGFFLLADPYVYKRY